MARLSHVVSSSESEPEPGESSQPENLHQSTSNANRRSKSVSAHRSEESVQKQDPDQEGENDPDNTIVVMVPVPKNPKEFVPYKDDTVNSILEELTGDNGETLYRVAFEDERQENVSLVFFSPHSDNYLFSKEYCGSTSLYYVCITCQHLACAVPALDLTSHLSKSLGRL